MACGAQMLLCLITLAVLPPDWLLPVAVAQQVPQGPGELDTELTTDPTGSLDESGPTTTSECREEQFPCTRLYSVHKPVKQCISYLCITSVRRTYMINKEICSRVVCKEDEAMQEKICRQMAGLPSRRLRRTGHPPRPLCRWAQNQPRNTVDAQ